MGYKVELRKNLYGDIVEGRTIPQAQRSVDEAHLIAVPSYV